MIQRAKEKGIDLHSFPRYDMRIRGVIQSLRRDEETEQEGNDVAAAYGISDETAK